MAREIYCKDVTFSKYSLWHRQQHNCLGMIDIDKVSVCHACCEPLFLAETVEDVNQLYKKGHTTTRKLAVKAGLVAFIIWYRFVGDMPMSVKVKKIAPDYKHGYASEPVRYSFPNWLRYLEKKQVDHFPNCPKKDLFIKKVMEDPIARKSNIYAPILRSRS